MSNTDIYSASSQNQHAEVPQASNSGEVQPTGRQNTINPNTFTNEHFPKYLYLQHRDNPETKISTLFRQYAIQSILGKGEPFDCQSTSRGYIIKVNNIFVT